MDKFCLAIENDDTNSFEPRDCSFLIAYLFWMGE